MYQGYLLKVNGNIFPNSLIRAQTYNITPDQITDLDDYTDNDGYLHRFPLPHTATKIEFNVPTKTDKEWDLIRELLPFSTPFERVSVEIEYYNPYTGEYKEATVYIPEVSFAMYSADKENIRYEETRLAFIEY